MYKRQVLELAKHRIAWLLILMISATFTGKIIKMCIRDRPIIAKKIKLDPAIMASPLITTIVDAVALILYFTTATRLLCI